MGISAEKRGAAVAAEQAEDDAHAFEFGLALLVHHAHELPHRSIDATEQRHAGEESMDAVAQQALSAEFDEHAQSEDTRQHERPASDVGERLAAREPQAEPGQQPADDGGRAQEIV